MLNLTGSTRKLQLVTSSTADLHAHVSFVDDDTSTDDMTPDGQNTIITTATTTDICAAPTGSIVRNIKTIHLRNKHASTSNDVTIVIDVSATDYELFKCTLAAGEELVYRDGVFFHYDSQGGVYGRSLPTASTTVEGGVILAAQGDQETGTSTTKAVTPGVQQYHPSACKAWHRTTVSGGTPTLANSYNITSITDTATGQLTVTIATDFSGVNYAIVTGVERAGTALTVANIRNCGIRNATVAAGSFVQECWDQTATTAVAVDPATWYASCFGDQ